MNHFILYNTEKAREKRVGVTYASIWIQTGLYLLKFIFMLAYMLLIMADTAKTIIQELDPCF